MQATPHSPTTAPAHPSSALLSLEGIEGAGKSTQGERLRQYLQERGKQATLFREPGSTPFGEGLRQAILQCQGSQGPQNLLDAIAEAYLFASSRAQLLHQEILPRLQRPNQVVIVDRYYDSSVAYQGFARGLGAETIARIHQYPPLNLMPHLTYYLHIPAALAMSRLAQRGRPADYFESQGEPFFAQLIEGYQWCVEHYPQRIVRLEGDRPVDDLARDVATTLEQRLGQLL